MSPPECEVGLNPDDVITFSRSPSPDEITPEKREISYDELLDRIRSSSWYLVVLTCFCSLAWGNGAIGIMASAFFNIQNATMVTVAEEFEIDTYTAQVTSSMFMVGNVIGGLLASVLADRFGRRPVFVFCSMGLAAVFILLSITPSVPLFMAGRLLHGVFYTGSSSPSWVLSFECTPKEIRGWNALYFGISWVVGYCAVLGIYSIASTWRQMMVFCSLPIFVFAVIAFFFLPESLHWLVINGNQKQIDHQWMRRIDDPKLVLKADVEKSGDERVSKWRLLSHMAESRTLLLLVIGVATIWVSDAFIYFGLSLHSTSLAGNFELNYALMGLIELPGYVIAKFALDGCRRRFLMCSTHALSAVAFLALMLVPAGSATALCFWMLGKLAITVAYMNIYVMGSEIFPTQLRNSSMGLCGAVSRLGGVLAPYVNSLEVIGPLAPLFAFTAFSLMGAAVGLALPETYNKSLDEINITTETPLRNDEESRN